MKKVRYLMLATLAAFLFVACGDDDNTSKPADSGAPDKKPQIKKEASINDDMPVNEDKGTTNPEQGVKEDSTKPKPEQVKPGDCDPAKIGMPCAADADCGGGDNICGDSGGIYFEKICSCTCTPDDPKTTLYNEDTCPNNPTNLCVTIPDTTDSFCMQTCTPKLGSNECQGSFACDTSISSYGLELYDTVVCLVEGCTADADCQVIGKKCTVGGTGECDTNQQCLPEETGSSAGRCVGPGSCETTSGLCQPHNNGKATAKVGDPCETDYDCAGNMRCFTEYDSSKPGKPGPIITRNGYCVVLDCLFPSLTSGVCPADSQCNMLYYRGICMKNCDIEDATTCRNNPNDRLGDYECRGWNNIFSTFTAPICDIGPGMTCEDITIINAQMTCEYFGTDPSGTPPNKTNMSCRGLDNVPKTNAHDPAGYCLDDTPCSTTLRGQTPDAGVPDAVVPTPDLATPDL